MTVQPKMRTAEDAQDRTWWRREGDRLIAADPPPELVTAQREAEEARERLAMAERNGELAVGDLLIVASALAQQKCQCVTTPEAHTRCDRCAAMDATAASVDQHTAEIERRGAAKEWARVADKRNCLPKGIREYAVARLAELESA